MDSIPPQLKAALMPIVKLLKAVNEEIKQYEQEIDRLGHDHYPVTQVLQQIPGIGPITSLAFVLTLDDVRRFKSGRDVGAYLGLVPRQKSSGECNPQLHITKAGDREMRRLLVLCANYVLGHFGPDCDLRRFGLKIAATAATRTGRNALVSPSRASSRC